MHKQLLGPKEVVCTLDLLVECSNIILRMLQVLTLYLLVSFADNLCNSLDPQNVGLDLDSDGISEIRFRKS